MGAGRISPWLTIAAPPRSSRQASAPRMDFLFWLLATIGGWIVTKMLDALCERWQKTRTRRTPLTDTQVLAYHRRRFRTMAFLVAWCALMLVGSIATAPAVHSVW